MEKLQPMNNLDYFVELDEMKVLEGGRLSGVYDAANGFRLKFNAGGERNATVQNGIRLHLTSLVEPAPPAQSSFVRLLRDKLDNAIVEKVEQANFDRIVQISFAKKEKFRLVLEQFGKGNLILTDGEGKIIRPMRGEEFSSRKLRVGEKYAAPPSAKLHPRELDGKMLDEISNSGGDKPGIVAILSSKINFPPFYLEEACARAGIGFSAKVAQIEGKKLEQLVSCIKSMAAGEGTSPCVFYSGGQPVAFSAFKMEKFAQYGFERKAFATFSDALDDYYRHGHETRAREEGSQKTCNELSKLAHSIDAQKEAIGKFEGEERENRAAGEWIYENYEKVERALEEARKKGEKNAVIDAEAIS
ncbi:NFACT family protein [Candidatus Micrarchaeota archaeon]|nr:NFACT family protein [Candidatus Micrarchaeota archaeon]